MEEFREEENFGNITIVYSGVQQPDGLWSANFTATREESDGIHETGLTSHPDAPFETAEDALENIREHAHEELNI